MLKNGQDLLIVLNYSPVDCSRFKISGVEYVIKKSGMWSTFYTVAAQGKPVLTLKQGFWGSKGTATFFDGSCYQLNYNYRSGFKLSFHDDQTVLLAYSTEFQNRRPLIAFSLGTGLIDADQLLVLSALGFVIFYQVFSEYSSGEDAAILLTIL